MRPTSLLAAAAAVLAAASVTGWSAVPAGAQLPVPTPSPTTTAAPGGGGGGGGGHGSPPSSTPPPSSPIPTTPTTTTPPTTASPTTAPPSSGTGSSGTGSSSGGAWWVPPAGGIPVPAWAQAIIDAVPRTPPNDNSRLLAALKPLEDLGMTAQEAAILGSGRFPIAGPAHFSDDFLFPRWGPAFRFHQGCDVLADYGLPIRAPADGVASVGNGTLGGLSVTVTEPDGTYYYMAHMSGLADGIASGVPVHTGQVVGFVGDSGNAKGGPPHVHFEVHPHGGEAVDPKPVLDQWLLDAEARVPELLGTFRPAAPQSLVGTTIVRELYDDDPSEVPAAGATARPAAPGPAAAAPAAPGAPAGSAAPASTPSTEPIDFDQVDWDAVARLAEWQQARAGATAFLSPLLPPVLSGAVVGDG
jgi:murein DD-endopeptidase MepM/ murein hydrolase activator NlpD